MSVENRDHSLFNVTNIPIGEYLSSSATTSTSGLDFGFAIGGAHETATSGMIVLDASDPDSLSWTNKTNGAPIISGAEMQYARYGKQSVLIAFGGYPIVCSTLKP